MHHRCPVWVPMQVETDRESSRGGDELNASRMFLAPISEATSSSWSKPGSDSVCIEQFADHYIIQMHAFRDIGETVDRNVVDRLPVSLAYMYQNDANYTVRGFTKNTVISTECARHILS